jgi:site-specific DNA-methyltransferase (adenine-specific)
MLVYKHNGMLLFCDDVQTTKSIVPASIDLIVTSPPYNLGISYQTYNDTDSYEAYLSFSRTWLTNCFTWLRIGGRLCLNVPLDVNKYGWRSLGADITQIAKEVGFQYRSTIVWNEGNISRRTAWGSWLSASAPSVIAPVELIIVLYKDTWKRPAQGRQSDITRDEFITWTNGLWTFPGEVPKRVQHPAPFPLELPRRCIKLFSFVGDTVLDPFAGSGTTLLAALQTKRYAIGIDIDTTYCEVAKRRLQTYIAKELTHAS